MIQLGSAYSASSTTVDAQQQAARAVIHRICPQIESRCRISHLPAEDGHDVSDYSCQNDHLELRGNSGVAICSALNRYLQEVCHCDLSWCGDQLDIPAVLSDAPGSHRAVCPGQYRVYFNYCTLSYSCAWWDWARWEREIDFMAMKGINMPLAVVGLEAVWFHVLQQFGYTAEEAQAFLVGPAFLAWQWMTNIQTHAGPLPQSWIESHLALGQRIIRRQRELGMQPIQQAFSGFVPMDFPAKVPGAKVMAKMDWANFPGTAELDPWSEEFEAFGKAFLAEERRLFGANRFYAADPFHESAPPRTDVEYLNGVGERIFNIMTAAEPDAVWVMQSWSVRKEIAQVIPRKRLLMLDLNGSYAAKEYFWGHEFVIGVLHNFGGRTNLHGDLAKLAENTLARVRFGEQCANAVGSGLFMEGILQNPVFYNLALDLIWRDEAVDVTAWLHDYARRRYGKPSAAAEQAWDILLETAYREGTSGVENSSIFAARPALDCRKSGPNGGFGIPYDPEKLRKAWDLLWREQTALGQSDGYRYDLIDLGRQVLTNAAQEQHWRIRMAAASGSAAEYRKQAETFLQLLSWADRLTSTRREMDFFQFAADARRWGTSEAERRLYDFNAALLVSWWGPTTAEPTIFDYSWREWGGLLRDYYGVRWAQFHRYVAEKLERGEPYDDSALPEVYGRQKIRANEILSRLADWEYEWICADRSGCANTHGGELAAIAELYPSIQAFTDALYEPRAVAGRREFRQNLAESRFGAHVGEAVFEPGPADRRTETREFPLPPEIFHEGRIRVTLVGKGDQSGTLRRIQVSIMQDDLESARAEMIPGVAASQSVSVFLAQDGIVFNAEYRLRVTLDTPDACSAGLDIYLMNE